MDTSNIECGLNRYTLDKIDIPPRVGRLAASFLACTIPFGDCFYTFDDEVLGNPYQSAYHLNPEVAPVPGSLYGLYDEQEQFGAPQVIPVEIREFLNDKIVDAKSSIRNHQGESPTDACFEESRIILEKMYASHGRLPSKVVPTKDGAVYLSYRNTRNDATLRIEVDNDLDIVATITTKNGMIESGVFEDDFADQAIAILCGEVSAEKTTSGSRTTYA